MLKVVLDGLAFGEGPRWHEGRLFFSDMHAHEVVAMTPAGARETIARFDGPVSGLGWLPDGRMLVVSMEDRRVLRREADGRFVQHADLSGIASWHTNDMVVDREGGAYVGNFGFDLHKNEAPKNAKLARIDPNGAVREAADEMAFANGMVITPDHMTLIVGESWGARLTAFDIGAGGALSNRRVFAQLPDGALPDGICLDAEGAVWCASPTTNEVLRMGEGSKVLARIKTDRQAIACMLGGADRKTLYVLTSETTDPDECIKRKSARIEAATVDVAGAGLP